MAQAELESIKKGGVKEIKEVRVEKVMTSSSRNIDGGEVRKSGSSSGRYLAPP